MTILKAENISKQYRLGLVGTGTLSHDLNRWWASIRGKEDPYLKVGSVNDRSTKADSEYVWALRDINFEVKQGEVLGIIGKNGAGKSTLLKILSRVTIPTTGEIKTKGRIASLLEVGTGFHPELTGRENIYLNGAILGMTKAEIKSKEAEIIEFSGCERYIDTPVKRYSSGMRVRLAFAVAAFLEPDILVIDEVLAVGDAEFQKKAIGKMQDISRGDGRTVLFVSHNMVSILNLCSRVICMEHGKIIADGPTEETIDFYLNNQQDKIANENFKNIDSNKEISVKEFNIMSKVKTGHVFNSEIIIHSKIEVLIQIAFTISTAESQPIYQIYSGHVGESFKMKVGDNKVKIVVDSLPLVHGSYLGNLWVGTSSLTYDFHKEVINFEVQEGAIRCDGPISSKNGYPIIENANWEFYE
ncbi:lipopolysaccharide transport system ATP-binding protein [Winogradskyella epiphytica]|uniref:Lipopolysaccharide transport system ATP-binding protein n=1 Tax=Winogradskyella epiphytica TaxID=262005 RepID=A0A2V4WY21_9FLAO|nr:ABC transporter ATP-binding protein [Winogradskyella epiphytica]PYE82150.1 lipopolysaccharide transport system ATP-binding protein [Winogradskyella epiphytica]GGW60214.1 ABC transporter ATP-binding protein [Winogradskyella epiphytica]